MTVYGGWLYNAEAVLGTLYYAAPQDQRIGMILNFQVNLLNFRTIAVQNARWRQENTDEIIKRTLLERTDAGWVSMLMRRDTSQTSQDLSTPQISARDTPKTCTHMSLPYRIPWNTTEFLSSITPPESWKKQNIRSLECWKRN